MRKAGPRAEGARESRNSPVAQPARGEMRPSCHRNAGHVGKADLADLVMGGPVGRPGACKLRWSGSLGSWQADEVRREQQPERWVRWDGSANRGPGGACGRDGGARAGSGMAGGDRAVASYVDPFVGTTGGGNTFPGPVLPGGMIQLGPDTVASSSYPTGSSQPSGYDYGASELRGFSLDRMSGAGCAEFGDVPITPTTASITKSPVSDPTSGNLDSSYFLGFSHRHERASPGSYAVTLNPASGPGPVAARLTTATRSAMALFDFPARAATSSVILNAAGSVTGNHAASVRIDPARGLITGSSTSGGFCASPDHYTVYFAAQFDRPFSAYGTWRRQSLYPGSTANSDTGIDQPVSGYLLGHDPRAQTGAYVSFNTRRIHVVGLKVAISYVSVAGAEKTSAPKSESSALTRSGPARLPNGAVR